jgi:L-amino acid N-acyltransferase YncA
MVRIRRAASSDIQTIAMIYGHYVLHSPATFEIDPPDAADMDQRRLTVQSAGLPFVVAEVDGSVAGYAYASRYRPRPAYRFTVEDSIYIHPDAVGQGLGRQLLLEVIAACTKAGARQMIAVIGDSANTASVRLHKALGFRDVGVLQSVGYKFERWYDTVLMQRELEP